MIESRLPKLYLLTFAPIDLISRTPSFQAIHSSELRSLQASKSTPPVFVYIDLYTLVPN